MSEPNEAYDITLLQVSLAGYYCQAIDYGAHAAGEEAGVEVTTLAAEGYASPDLQLSQVEDAISRNAPVSIHPVARDMRTRLVLMVIERCSFVPVSDP